MQHLLRCGRRFPATRELRSVLALRVCWLLPAWEIKLPAGREPGSHSRVQDPRTPDQNRLALLGVDGVRVTPLELASAYRWLPCNLPRIQTYWPRRWCAPDFKTRPASVWRVRQIWAE